MANGRQRGLIHDKRQKEDERQRVDLAMQVDFLTVTLFKVSFKDISMKKVDEKKTEKATTILMVLQKIPYAIDGQKLNLVNKGIQCIGKIPSGCANAIAILYLSQNALSHVNGIEQFQQIQVLSIAGNLITTFDALDPLERLVKLRILSLCHNPVMELPHARFHVLSRLGKLDMLDNIAITNVDRKRAAAIIQQDARAQRQLLDQHSQIQGLQHMVLLMKIHLELTASFSQASIYIPKIESFLAFFSLNWHYTVEMQQRMAHRLLVSVQKTKNILINTPQFRARLLITKGVPSSVQLWQEAYDQVLALQNRTVVQLHGICGQLQYQLQQRAMLKREGDPHGLISQAYLKEDQNRINTVHEREALLTWYQGQIISRREEVSKVCTSSCQLPPQQMDPDLSSDTKEEEKVILHKKIPREFVSFQLLKYYLRWKNYVKHQRMRDSLRTWKSKIERIREIQSYRLFLLLKKSSRILRAWQKIATLEKVATLEASKKLELLEASKLEALSAELESEASLFSSVFYRWVDYTTSNHERQQRAIQKSNALNVRLERNWYRTLFHQWKVHSLLESNTNHYQIQIFTKRINFRTVQHCFCSWKLLHQNITHFYVKRQTNTLRMTFYHWKKTSTKLRQTRKLEQFTKRTTQRWKEKNRKKTIQMLFDRWYYVHQATRVQQIHPLQDTWRNWKAFYIRHLRDHKTASEKRFERYRLLCQNLEVFSQAVNDKNNSLEEVHKQLRDKQAVQEAEQAEVISQLKTSLDLEKSRAVKLEELHENDLQHLQHCENDKLQDAVQISETYQRLMRDRIAEVEEYKSQMHHMHDAIQDGESKMVQLQLLVNQQAATMEENNLVKAHEQQQEKEKAQAMMKMVAMKNKQLAKLQYAVEMQKHQKSYENAENILQRLQADIGAHEYVSNNAPEITESQDSIQSDIAQMQAKVLARLQPLEKTRKKKRIVANNKKH